MNLLKRIFYRRRDVANSILKRGEEISIEVFINLCTDKRIKTIIEYGDTGDLKYYPLLKYSILNDPDASVKFSALKRIHLFKNVPDCVNMLIDLKDQLNTDALEPYYSMALSKTGIISLQEFEKRINKF